jgi:hypothetical protein
MNELRIDSFGRRRVSPFDGSSGLVVVPDVTKDFSSEIVEGGKNAAGDDLSLDLGEPDFDLVKPRRIGGCKMHADLGMTGQEIVDELSFMSREIVGNHVDMVLILSKGKGKGYPLQTSLFPSPTTASAQLTSK